MPEPVHVIGSLMVDRVLRVATLPRAGETVTARSATILPGGKGANQAVAAAVSYTHLTLPTILRV